ncbi:hypothetical protein NKK46_32420 [Mesorhizobium sp. M0013]
MPLIERGVRVDGIDNSDSMLKLLAKRTDRVRTWTGDIANFKTEQRYARHPRSTASLPPICRGSSRGRRRFSD